MATFVKDSAGEFWTRLESVFASLHLARLVHGEAYVAAAAEEEARAGAGGGCEEEEDDGTKKETRAKKYIPSLLRLLATSGPKRIEMYLLCTPNLSPPLLY